MAVVVVIRLCAILAVMVARSQAGLRIAVGIQLRVRRVCVILARWADDCRITVIVHGEWHTTYQHGMEHNQYDYPGITGIICDAVMRVDCSTRHRNHVRTPYLSEENQRRSGKSGFAQRVTGEHGSLYEVQDSPVVRNGMCIKRRQVP